MDLTYQVYDASWTPSYDVRITTDPVATTKAQMKLYYFGNIRQNTGEEWKDVQLVLSTAQPRLAGPLPKLGTLRAKFHKEEPAQAQYQVAPQYMMMRTEACMDAAPMRRMAKMAHQVSSIQVSGSGHLQSSEMTKKYSIVENLTSIYIASKSLKNPYSFSRVGQVKFVR